MSFKALGDRVFVRPDVPEERIGSLIIPHSARKKVGTGLVKYHGPGMLTKTGERWPMPLRVGDRVMFNSDMPFMEVEIAGEKLLAMRDNDVFAVVENDR